MNMRAFLDKKLQYHYFLHGIPPRRRFAKWPKPEKHEDVELVQEIFNCNETRAVELLSLLDKDKLNTIKEHNASKGLVK